MDNKEHKSTKSNYVYDQLKEKILSGEYPPNKVMKQSDIAAEFGVSTVPVREALSRLTTEGFILHMPYVGVMVSKIDKNYLSDVYELRTILESAAATKAIENIDKYDLEQLEIMLSEMEEKMKIKDISGYQTVNENFHFFLYNKCGNDVLVEQIKILWKRFPRDTFAVISSRLARSFEEHTMIVAAIRADDPVWCNALIVNHIKGAQQDIKDFNSRRALQKRPVNI